MFGKINKGKRREWTYPLELLGDETQRLFESGLSKSDNQPLLAVLGEGENGEVVTLDLSQHSLMLLSGRATGSGYHMGGNLFIASIMSHSTPDQVNFAFIDPSRTLDEFNNSPFLDPQAVHISKESRGVLGDTQESISYLEWVWKEKNRRMELLSQYEMSLSKFNEGVGKKRIPSEKMKPLIVVIDQYSTLNGMSSGKADELIEKIGAYDTKEAGIHVILYTYDIYELKDRGLLSLITGRWIFKMRTPEDSKVVLGVQGAEDLKGYGDSYLYQEGDNELMRIQTPLSTPLIDPSTPFVMHTINEYLRESGGEKRSTIKRIIKNSWDNGLIANIILWWFFLTLVCSFAYIIYGIFEWFI